MDIIYIILIIILLLLNIVFFILGNLYAHINNKTIERPLSFIDRHKAAVETQEIEKTTIDDSKYVTKIRTDDIEILYDSLGKTQNSSENIESSINKLKNMKG